MGEHGDCGASPSQAGSMHTLGVAIGVCVFLLEGLLILRGWMSRVFNRFPLFYSYVIYCFCWAISMYLIAWLRPQVYPSTFWICYLVSILVEFAVLVEISDHIFLPFPAIRNLGRAFTILISAALGLLYVWPAILSKASRSRILLDFTLRASVTKAIILLALFYVSRRYRCGLGRNLGGLMLGFCIYLAMNVAMMASAMAFGSALFANVLWFMSPLAFALCLSVWTVSLWNLAPTPILGGGPKATRHETEALATELTRFNGELTKLMHK